MVPTHQFIAGVALSNAITYQLRAAESFLKAFDYRNAGKENSAVYYQIAAAQSAASSRQCRGLREGPWA